MKLMEQATRGAEIFTGSMETRGQRAHSAVPYLATVFYGEIMLFLLFSSFLYGKTAAVFAGVALTLLLTVHVLLLFNGSAFCRRVQLLLMDFHIAWSAVFLAGRIISDLPLSGFDLTVMAFRGLAASIELALLVLITADI